jgi:cold shock CspA family protein
MSLALGKVDKYLSDKGFGFVKPVFMNNESVDSIFFHISAIKNKSFANKLKSDTLDDSYYFWFDFRRGPKGFEVTNTIRESDVADEASDPEKLTSKLELYWFDITNSMPDWVELASTSLGLDVEYLNLQRNIKKEEIKKFKIIEEQNKLQEQSTVPKDEYERVKAVCCELRGELRVIKNKLAEVTYEYKEAKDKWECALDDPSIFEFELLVKELENLDIKVSKSHEVSRYIVDNRLGDKYQSLAGELEMENDSRQWKFDGGIDPKYYKKLCQRLGLTNKNTFSRVRKFVAYKDINKYV